MKFFRACCVSTTFHARTYGEMIYAYIMHAFPIKVINFSHLLFDSAPHSTTVLWYFRVRKQPWAKLSRDLLPLLVAAKATPPPAVRCTCMHVASSDDRNNGETLTVGYIAASDHRRLGTQRVPQPP